MGFVQAVPSTLEHWIIINHNVQSLNYPLCVVSKIIDPIEDSLNTFHK